MGLVSFATRALSRRCSLLRVMPIPQWPGSVLNAAGVRAPCGATDWAWMYRCPRCHWQRFGARMASGPCPSRAAGVASEARPAAASQAHQRCHAPWLGPVGEVCAPWSAAHGQQGIRHLFAGKRSAISRSSPQPGRLLKRLVHSSRWIRARVDSLAETAWLRWAGGAASPDSRKLCNTSPICNTQPRVRISPLCATPLGELSAMAIQEEA